MDVTDYTLGENNTLISFDSRLDNREIATSLIRQAKYRIRILTPDLENPVYDNLELNQSLSRLASLHKHSSINILVSDSTAAVKQGHRIIELARQFNSSIHLHQTPQDRQEMNFAMLIADDSGYLYKHHGDSYQGQACFYDKSKVRELAKTFDDAWERSQSDPELRRLFI